MYKIMNQGKRSFIVAANEVLKDGSSFKNKAKDIVLEPGQKVYEVTDKLGKDLKDYPGVLVVEIVKEHKKGK